MRPNRRMALHLAPTRPHTNPASHLASARALPAVLTSDCGSNPLGRSNLRSTETIEQASAQPDHSLERRRISHRRTWDGCPTSLLTKPIPALPLSSARRNLEVPTSHLVRLQGPSPERSARGAHTRESPS
jgi:hypothetical protein